MAAKKAALAAIVRGSDEAEETVRAICEGEVDAFVIEDGEGNRVYTLEGSDLPYSVLVERMQQGAAIVDARGEIIYSNPSLDQLVGVETNALIGVRLQQFLSPKDQILFQKLLNETEVGPREGEMSLHRADCTQISTNFSFRLLSRDKSSTGILITDLTWKKQQAELTSRIQQLQDEERRRIARELHDSVGQLLAAISMNFVRVRDEAHRLSPAVAKAVSDNETMVNQISDEIRTISHLLHPPLLDEVGLPSALRWYTDGFAQRSNIQTTLDIPAKFDRLSPDTEIAIFRAVQECLTNVHRHSGSATCSIKMVQEADWLRIEVTDSGCGIPEPKRSTLDSSGGVGLRGMRERIRQLGGTFEIETNSKGTVIKVSLPVPSENLSTGKGNNVA